MEAKEKYPSINVFNVFMGFKNGRLRHPITPIRFDLPSGDSHQIASIRQTHKERVGQATHHHFVVQTKEQRCFHILFDTGELQWKFVQEFDADYLFK